MVEPFEKDIQRTICEWLDLNKYLFWRQNNVPIFGKNNGGNFVHRSMPKYTPKGLPDIMCIVKGEFIGIEVKRPKMKLRPEQAEFGAKLSLHGGKYYTVHSLEELLSLPEFHVSI